MEKDLLQKIIGRKDLEDALRTTISGGGDINLYLPTYTKDVKDIVPYKRTSDLIGYVKHDSPSVVNIASPLNEFQTKMILGHEAEHSQQLESKKWIEEQLKKDPKYRIPNLLGTSRDFIGREEVWKQNLEINKSAQDAYKKYQKKYNLTVEFPEKNSELMADMVGIEATLPRGQSVLDTDIGKDIFNTPEKRRWYLASSLPNTTKMLESNPGQFELAMQKAKQALQEFKDKSLYDSYFGAALSAFQKLFGGK